MGEEEAQLKTALAAIAAENRFIREAHSLSKQRLTDLQYLVDKMALDLERDGANLAVNSKNAVDASAKALLNAREDGTPARIDEAEEVQRLTWAMYASVWNLRASLTHFRIEFAGRQQVAPR